MNSIKSIVVFLLLIGFNTIGISQNKSDSLEELIDVLSRQKTYDSVLIDVYKKIANEKRYSEPVSAIEYGGTAYQKAQQLPDSLQKARTGIFLGDLYFNNKEYYIAMKYYLDSYKTFSNFSNKKEIAACLIKIGKTYLAQDIDDMAFEYFKNAQAISKTINDKFGESIANQYIGSLYIKQDINEIAISYLNKALEFFKSKENKFEISKTLTLLAKAEINLEKFSEAIEHLNNSIQINQQINNIQNIAENKFLLGCIYSLQSKSVEAELEFKNSLDIYQKLNYQLKIGEVYNKMASIALLKNDYKNAADFLNKSIYIGNDKSILSLKKEAYKIFADIYLKQGKNKEGIQMQSKYVSICDSIVDEGVRRQFYELQILYETHKLESDTKLLKVENNRKSDLLNERKYLMIVLVFLIILSIGVLIIMFFKNKQNLKANKLLYEKNCQIQKQANILEHTLEQLGQRESQLREVNLAKDKMLSIIAFDLRTPIGNLKQFLELLADSPDSLDKRTSSELLQSLRNTAVHTYDLLENLLLWSTAQKGELSFKPQSIDIESLVDDNLLLLKGIARSKNLNFNKIIIEISNVFADRNMVSMITRNLIHNAIKYSHQDGEVDLKFEILKVENQKDKTFKSYQQFSVIDRGVGIKADNLGELFNKQMAFISFGVDDEKGSGLGLIICKEFIDKNNGKIWVESEINKGSTFSIALPLAES